jgi:hypothetical protein
LLDAQPSNGSLDDPTTRKQHKALGLSGALEDFDFDSRQDVVESFLEFRSLVATISKKASLGTVACRTESIEAGYHRRDLGYSLDE